MKVTRAAGITFLTVLLVSSFFALSAYILGTQFCALERAHGNGLCEIINRLEAHNLFAVALASVFVVAAAVLSGLRFPGELGSPDTGASAPFHLAESAPSLARFMRWLRLHFNSPNFLLRA
ncbi:hypothetical protein C4587_02275 [Candidatus Parcubacteria bacterium]|nr:MAG: hypothetical protein C4587_02275 [Candidatus Parcubacteria bacterium]